MQMRECGCVWTCDSTAGAGCANRREGRFNPTAQNPEAARPLSKSGTECSFIQLMKGIIRSFMTDKLRPCLMMAARVTFSRNEC